MPWLSMGGINWHNSVGHIASGVKLGHFGVIIQMVATS